MRIDEDPDPVITADEVTLERTDDGLVLTVIGEKPGLNVSPMRSLRDRIEPLLIMQGVKAEEISLLVTPDASGILILPHDRWDSLEEIRGNPVINGSGRHPKLMMGKLKVIAGDVSIFNGTRAPLPVLREVQGDLLLGHDVEIPAFRNPPALTLRRTSCAPPAERQTVDASPGAAVLLQGYRPPRLSRRSSARTSAR